MAIAASAKIATKMPVTSKALCWPAENTAPAGTYTICDPTTSSIFQPKPLAPPYILIMLAGAAEGMLWHSRQLADLMRIGRAVKNMLRPLTSRKPVCSGSFGFPAEALDQGSLEAVRLVEWIGRVERGFLVAEVLVVLVVAEELEHLACGVPGHRFADELGALVEQRLDVFIDVLAGVLPHRVHRLQQDLRLGDDFALGLALQRLVIAQTSSAPCR